MRILRYLKAQPGRGLLYHAKGHLRVEVFTDADWACSPSDRRSTTGYCTFLGGNLVSWKSKKQTVIARSSAEAECQAMTYISCKLMWMRHLLEDLCFEVKLLMSMYCDNQTTIYIISNPVFHEKTKHIELD